MQPTGHDRRIEVITVTLSQVRSAAHADGVTVNDAVLVAVAGALRGLLTGRGERLATLHIAVMVAGMMVDAAAGNRTVPVVVSVDLDDPEIAQLQQVSGAVRAAVAMVRSGDHSAVSSAAAGAALLRTGPVRALYQVCLNDQRRFHTLVSTLRGPTVFGSIGGHVVAGIIPLSTGELGNTVFQFLALSTGDSLVVTVTTDSDHDVELAILTQELERLLVRRHSSPT